MITFPINAALKETLGLWKSPIWFRQLAGWTIAWHRL